MEHLFTSDVADRTLGRILRRRAEERPEHPFLITPDGSWTYEQTRARSARIAFGLQALGVGRGDRVIVMLPNCVEFVAVWFACAQIGAVQVPVNTAYKGMLLEHIVANSGARVAVVAHEHVERFFRDRPPFDEIQHLVVVPSERALTADAVPFAQLEAGREASLSEVAHTDPLAIMYSSGTTGPSKGILLSHSYFWFGGSRFAHHVGATPDDRLYTCLPLFHANAQVLSVMGALVTGATVIVDSRFSASRFWNRVRETRATLFNYIGGMIPILLKQDPSTSDREHAVRFAIGAAAPADQFREFEDRFGVRLLESYGQTENCVALSNPVGAPRVGSVGQANCGYDVQIVDESDELVEPGVVGELVFRPQFQNIMMDGYHGMPEATAAATRNLWFHTGDLMWRDEDGYYYFVDRKKDAIRRRGENISAYEVEMVVNSHPAVLESAAVAAPSEVGEDEVMVFVVPIDGGTIDPLDLVRHCETRMPYFAVPRYVELRRELPKTSTHRVEKYRLRAEGVGPQTWDRECAGYRLAR